MQPRGKDFYLTLGARRNATQEELKKVYREAAKRYHPDKNKGNAFAERKFKEISEAYSILGDKKKRAEYDRLGTSPFDENSFRNYRASHRSNSSQFDFSEIFNDFFAESAFENFSSFSQDGGFQKAQRECPQKGENVHVEVKVPFLDATRGCKREITFQAKRKCTLCHGTGKAHGRLCTGCRGTKIAPSTVCLDVKIPDGTEDGLKIRLQKQGNAGVNGGLFGDVILKVLVGKHATFTRKGDDILTVLSISPSQAEKGDKVEICTLNGSSSVTVPKGSYAGQKLRLRGLGARNMKTFCKGDMIVTLRIRRP